MIHNKEPYILEKAIWTDEDFDIMGWHDANIYALAFENGGEDYCGDFVLDIDYIFKWVDPVPPEKYFSFWVAPCTLVFKNALQIKIDIDTAMFALEGLQISHVTFECAKSEMPENRYDYVIHLQEGQISLQAAGFSQIVRQLPVYGDQSIELKLRGGISFNRTPATTNNKG